MNRKKGLFGAKSRIIILLMAIAAIVAAAIWFYMSVRKDEKIASGASVAASPAIKSVPGISKASTEYEKDVSKRNIASAKKAQKEARSSVPTPTRASLIGDLSQFELPKKSDKSVLKIKEESCTRKSIGLAIQAGVTPNELVCQGCTCPELKDGGFSAAQLKNIGYSAKRLRACGFTLAELIKAGYTAKDLKDAGFSAAELKKAGFTAAQLRVAGFSAKALKAAGFSAKQLAAAGFSAKQLLGAGFTAKQLEKAGISLNQGAKKARCDLAYLRKQRMEGVSAKVLRDEGCGLAALKAAGYTAKELKDAGFTAAQLKAAGFSAKQLKDAGFDAAALKAAGFTAQQLKNAGFSARQLKAAGFSAAQLKAAGYTAAQLKSAGFPAKAIHDAGFDADQAKEAGYTAASIKRAGYTKGAMIRAGFTPEQAGYVSVASSAAQIQPKPKPQSSDLGASSSLPQMGPSTPQNQLEQLDKLQQQRMSMQQRRNQLAAMQSAMTSQAGKMISTWQSIPQQGVKVGVSSKPVAGAAASAQAGQKIPKTGPIYKAGSVMFAVLDTSIDSDEQTPILATIVSGPLKGSKLIGRFVSAGVNAKKLMITFSLINNPYMKKTLPISVVAIDPNTARTALSGQVNNHYLLRYGSLFASSFLEGVGSSLQAAQTTSTTNGLFSIVKVQPPNPLQATLIGLGKAGSRYAQTMSNVINRLPTIKIAGGTGIGLLFTADFQLPTPIPSTS